MKEPHKIEDICPKCRGMGFRSEHDPSDGSEEHMVYGNCTSCPIQVQCEECEGQGRILFTEVAKCIRCNDNGCPACESKGIYHDGKL